jgi:hypothetical protein
MHFGVTERESNGTYDRTVPYPVTTHFVREPVFGLSDMRGSAQRPGSFALLSFTKLLLLLKAVIEPEWDGLKGVNWKQAKLFVPPALSDNLGLLRDHSLMHGARGTPHRILDAANILTYKWQPGVRYHFKRLFLLDTMPPAATAPDGADPIKKYTNLKLALRRTRQSWRIHHDSLYRVLMPRRGALLLHRVLVRAAAGLADGTATAHPLLLTR